VSQNVHCDSLKLYLLPNISHTNAKGVLLYAGFYFVFVFLYRVYIRCHYKVPGGTVCGFIRPWCSATQTAFKGFILTECVAKTLPIILDYINSTLSFFLMRSMNCFLCTVVHRMHTLRHYTTGSKLNSPTNILMTQKLGTSSQMCCPHFQLSWQEAL
jgi:hypothetical protein